MRQGLSPLESLDDATALHADRRQAFVTGIDNGRIGKRSELRTKALTHFAFAAAFEVHATRRAAEQRIAREENADRCLPWCGQG